MENNETNFNISKTIENLVLVVRDCDLDYKAINKYEKGMIIKENNFTYANYVIGGMTTNCRFAILSNQFKEFSSLNVQKGLCLANINSRFKILDIFSINGRTQITLLHLPDDERWKAFKDITYIVEPKLIFFARKNFEATNSLAPIPEQKSEELQKYFASPLGMNNQGQFNSLE